MKKNNSIWDFLIKKKSPVKKETVEEQNKQHDVDLESLKITSGLIINREKMGLWFILALMILVSLIFFNMVKIFLVPVILASTFATLFYSFYQKILKILKYRKNLSAFLCCLIILLILLIPTYVIGHLVTLQALELFDHADGLIKETITESNQPDFLNFFFNSQLIQAFQMDKIDWRSIVLEAAKAGSTLATNIINTTYKGVIDLVVNLFIVLFTLFYFFRDGHKIVKRLIYLSPLRPVYEQKIIKRFTMISRATVKGTLLIGLIQGSIGAATLLICGIKTWILWGVVMVILSIIPMVGAWIVLLPIGILQLLTSHFWQGIVIILMSTIIISNIDNLIRPRLVGQDAKIHDLLIFFSTLGGIGLFGIMGFIIGPIIAVLFMTLIDIYAAEFKATLTQELRHEESAQEK